MQSRTGRTEHTGSALQPHSFPELSSLARRKTVTTVTPRPVTRRCRQLGQILKANRTEDSSTLQAALLSQMPPFHAALSLWSAMQRLQMPPDARMMLPRGWPTLSDPPLPRYRARCLRPGPLCPSVPERQQKCLE